MLQNKNLAELSVKAPEPMEVDKEVKTNEPKAGSLRGDTVPEENHVGSPTIPLSVCYSVVLAKEHALTEDIVKKATHLKFVRTG